jgi:hypothetical protein
MQFASGSDPTSPPDVEPGRPGEDVPVPAHDETLVLRDEDMLRLHDDDPLYADD